MGFAEIAILTAIFFFGGFVKGTIGIALPSILIGLMTFFYEPRVAVAMGLMVIMTTNFRQAWVGGEIWPIIKRHSYFCACACIGIFFVAIVGGRVPLSILQTVVGVAMSVFALTNLFGSFPKLNMKYDVPVQIIAGTISSILGGLTAIWGPPLAVYLITLRMDKDTMIKTLGVMFSAQSIFLTAGFIISGELTARLALIGALLMIPAFAGMYLGENARKRLNTEQFTKFFLIAFLILGVNLIRRGLMGA